MLDLRLENAVVITMDDRHPTAHTIGIWNGQVVGVDEQVASLPARRTISLNGATVVPGFIDAHTHLTWAGRVAGLLDLSPCSTREAMLEAIGSYADTLTRDTDQWFDILGFDATKGVELTAADLDPFTGGRPAYVVDKSGHLGVVNTAALERIVQAGIDLDEIGVDRDVDGLATGILREGAHTAFRQRIRLPYSLDELTEAITVAARDCLTQGITTVAEAGIAGGMIGSSPLELVAFQRAIANGGVPLRVQTMIGHDALHPIGGAPGDGVELGLDLGVASGFGSDRIWVGPMKIWLDGGVQARSAAMSEPFEGTENRGELAGDPAGLIARVVAAHVSGWQLALHAIGDRAVDLAIEALEAAQTAQPRPDAMHRIEHCGIVRPDQLERLAACGAVAAIQPEFLWHHGTGYTLALGEERTHWQYRGRSLLDAGVPIIGSSDRPVVTGDPLQAIQFMVTRRDILGKQIGPDEAITVTEGLRAYTAESARVLGKADRLGSISAGKWADLAVLSADPRAVDPDAIAGIRVLQTMVAGEVVFTAAEPAA